MVSQSGWEADVAPERSIGDTTTMHPFPSAADLHFFVGKELQQICLGQWQVWLHFGGKAHISIEGGFEHVDKAGFVRSHNLEERLAPICFRNLCGQKVRLVEVQKLRLTLAFDGGDLIRVHTDEGPYERGQIYDDKGDLTVF